MPKWRKKGMNSKKVLALGMAAVMAAGMTGCSVPGEGGSTTAGTAQARQRRLQLMKVLRAARLQQQIIIQHLRLV